MAPKQAQFLIPADRILCTLVQADKDNGTINREFLFDGSGYQLTDGEVNTRAARLVLPAAATSEDAAAVSSVPVFDGVKYLALIKAKDLVAAGTMQGEYHQALDNVKASTGQQGLADHIISAIFEMLAKEDLGGWVVNKNSVICRVPTRATPETPVIVVVQPQPVWGTR